MNQAALGKLIQVCRNSPARLIALALIPAPFAAAFWAGVFLEKSVGRRIGFSIPAFLCLLPGIAALVKWFRGRGISLSLYENGFVYRGRGGQISATWDEIESFTRGKVCRIAKKDGQTIEFGFGIDGADEAACRIEDTLVEVMLPQVRAAILEGSGARFPAVRPAHYSSADAGDRFLRVDSGFTVDAAGITENDRGNRIEWRDITGYGSVDEEIGAGPGKNSADVFWVQDRAKGFKARIDCLSNPQVLLALCDEMVKDKTK